MTRDEAEQLIRTEVQPDGHVVFFAQGPYGERHSCRGKTVLEQQCARQSVVDTLLKLFPGNAKFHDANRYPHVCEFCGQWCYRGMDSLEHEHNAECRR